MDLKDIKLEYIREELNLEDLDKTPEKQIQKWFQQAINSEITYPNAATLSTVDSNGYPSSRIVLVKEINDNGIVFFTDYTSQKGLDIGNNNQVSILFFWKELDRQIRVNGRATKIDPIESEKYFLSRPRESQISALASNQSSPITKKELYERVEILTKKYQDHNIEYPNNWGGYNISFDEVEIWQGRPNRLHDRFQYNSQKQNWNIQRLSP